MPSIFSDELADGLRRMYLELRDRTEKLERQLPTLQRNYAREDFILLQASTTGSIPAVTASTTGITPGKTTVAKMLTINSSGKAVRTTTSRSETAYNIGTGEIAAGKPFPAHREFATGKWVTWGAAVAGGGGSPPPMTSIYVSSSFNFTASGTTYFVNFYTSNIFYPSGSTFTCPVAAATSSRDLKFTREFDGEILLTFTFLAEHSGSTGQTSFNAVGRMDMSGSGSVQGTRPAFATIAGQFGQETIRGSAGCIGRLSDCVSGDVLKVSFFGQPFAGLGFADSCKMELASAVIFETVTGTCWTPQNPAT